MWLFDQNLISVRNINTWSGTQVLNYEVNITDDLGGNYVIHSELVGAELSPFQN